MKSIDAKKLLVAVDQIHGLDSWEALGAATPRILDELIGADHSCWNVVRAGEFIELSGNTDYMPSLASLGEALVANMGGHPVVSNTGVFSGEITQGSFKMTDFVTQRDFEDTGLYREAYQHLDARHQMGTQVLIESEMEVILTINRQLKDFNDESLELLDSVKTHFAIACRRLLRERELKERISLLMEHASPGGSLSMTLDHRGRILETSGDVEKFLADRFKSLVDGVPLALRTYLAGQVFAVETGSRSFELADDFGGRVEVTLLQTGFGTRWTVLFHREQKHGVGANGHSMAAMSTLSVREKEVLHWIAEGKTNPEIAILLGIANRTVEKHCENIYQKLGVENRIAAAREWMERGNIEPNQSAGETAG